MRLIASVQGSSLLHVSADDVTPPGGVMARDLIEFVAQTYAFAVKPDIPPGIAPAALPALVFQSGELAHDQGKLPITNLVIVPNGEIVTSRTTDVADLIVNDYVSRLDSKFGYRFAQARQHRTHHSSVVVQFEGGIETRLRALGAIEEILNLHIPRPDVPFKIKRLGFGYGDIPAIPMMFSIDAFDKSDFVIERRASEPYSENRYFCSAPTSTNEHVRILGMIEEALS